MEPLVVMFYMSEHLFASLSLLKERPPTGGLKEACKESLGGGVEWG